MPRLLQARAAIHEPELRAAADGEVPERTLLQRESACARHQGCAAVGWAAHEWRKTSGCGRLGCAVGDEDGWGCPGGLACSLLEQNVERVCRANLALLQGRFQLLATGRRGELVDVNLDGDGDVELDAIALRGECTDTSGCRGHGGTARCERTRARRGQEPPSCREHGPSCQTVLSERLPRERIAGRIEKQLWDGVRVIFRQQCFRGLFLVSSFTYARRSYGTHRAEIPRSYPPRLATSRPVHLACCRDAGLAVAALRARASAS